MTVLRAPLFEDWGPYVASVVYTYMQQYQFRNLQRVLEEVFILIVWC